MGDAGFEPGTSAPGVWYATDEQPHLLYILQYILIQFIASLNQKIFLKECILILGREAELNTGLTGLIAYD